jgi:hypothetical protein
MFSFYRLENPDLFAQRWAPLWIRRDHTKEHSNSCFGWSPPGPETAFSFTNSQIGIILGSPLRVPLSSRPTSRQRGIAVFPAFAGVYASLLDLSDQC